MHVYVCLFSIGAQLQRLLPCPSGRVDCQCDTDECLSTSTVLFFFFLEELDPPRVGVARRLGVTRPRWVGGTKGSAGLSPAAGVVVVQVGGLDKLGVLELVHYTGRDLAAGDDGTDDQADKNDQQDKVEDSEANNTLPPKLGLLHRVDGRADLPAMREAVSGYFAGKKIGEHT